jgi:FK506-binding protein 4/5
MSEDMNNNASVLPTASQEDITGDGGVLKHVLVSGVGNEKPQTGDAVSVHYVGTLMSDGSQFDSSRDKNKPFNFRLGKGEVIKGWDKGVATMRRGEKAIFTIRSDYGYGAEGSGSSIPGDATLIFEVELLAWNEIDITNDGGVLIKVIDGHKGTGWRHPENNAEVHIKWEGRVNGTAFAASANNDFEFVQLGSPSCPLPSGVQRAISQEMKKDSRAQITAKPEYAFGAEGLPGQVPPHATVEYVVELKDWNTVHDVASDGGITVKLLGQIEAYGAKAEDASKVTMTIEGKVLPDGPVFMGPTEKVVIVGDGKMPEGVERGLEKIKKGHPAIITCHSRYAYGEHGNPDLGVPPNADVQFSVNVTDVRATYELNVQEKLAAADKRKLQGNDFFKAGDFERALGKYAKAFKLVEYEREDEDNEVLPPLDAVYLAQKMCA